jgi:hypothetical protein
LPSTLFVFRSTNDLPSHRASAKVLGMSIKMNATMIIKNGNPHLSDDKIAHPLDDAALFNDRNRLRKYAAFSPENE